MALKLYLLDTSTAIDYISGILPTKAIAWLDSVLDQEVETSKEKRIVILRQVTTYQYSVIINPHLNRNARILYEESRKALIYEHSGNVELLETIEVNPAYQAAIYPFLKREIIAAGGEWKRGEIPKLFVPGLTNDKKQN